LVKTSLTSIFGMSIATIDLRRAKADDAKGIAKVHEQSWRQAYTGIIPREALETMLQRRDEAWWARAIRHSTRIIILEDQSEIIGYATMGSNRVNALPQDGEIYEIYLLPEYQGVGLGKRLFLAARQELINGGMNGCIVWALEDNESALNFYINAGGKDIAEGTETFNKKTLRKVAYAWD